VPIRNRPFTSFGTSVPSRPYLHVQFLNPHSGVKRRLFGLIDTGADECALPAEFAKVFGHNYLKGKKRDIIGVGGHVEAFSHTMSIEIPGYGSYEALIDFVPGLTTVLLGVSSFLSNFVLTVDYKKKVFSLTKP